MLIYVSQLFDFIEDETLYPTPLDLPAARKEYNDATSVLFRKEDVKKAADSLSREIAVDTVFNMRDAKTLFIYPALREAALVNSGLDYAVVPDNRQQ